jgi:serine/threonine-protein kinase
MRSFFYAAVAWILAGTVVFVTTDLFIMPFIAGHFKGKVIVPSVVGLSPEEADLKLKDFTLICMVDSAGEYSPDIPVGLVLKQRPSPDIVVKRWRRVWLTISKGLRSVPVPVLKGNSVRQAEISLQQAGLKMGEIKYVAMQDIPMGVVFKSIPDADKVVEVNSSVDIHVSAGRKMVFDKVSSLVGMSLARAKAWISSAGMKLGNVAYKTDKDKLPDTVLEQEPAPGSPVDAGKPVNLVVSKK